MSYETIVLDPTAIDSTRSQLDITSFVASAGPSWGDAEISAAVAQQTFGGSIVGYTVPNRKIQIPLTLRSVGATSFTTIRTNIQQKVALFQREGGTIMRQIGATPLYADIVNATLHLGGAWLQAFRDADVEATLELECRPDWYADEVTLSDHVETTAAELIFTEATVNGTYPARCRIIVDNDGTIDQHGLIWGVRSRHYGAATTEQLAYEAESLQPLDAGTKVAVAGASGGTVMRHPALPAGAWTPVLSTNIGGTAYMTHKGSYRAWARCRSGTATPQVRFLWDVGDTSALVTNDAVQLPGAGTYYMMDLGEMRLDPAPTGPHRWQGIIQAQAPLQGNQIDIDRIWFQPLDESAGKLTTVIQDAPAAPSGISTRKLAGTAADDAAVGSLAWTTPNLITIEDANDAYATGPGTTHYLKGTAFGFSVPTGSTINGIFAEVKRSDAYVTGSIVDYRVRLIKAGAIQTPDKADTITPWPGADTWKGYGGAADLWSGAWTPADVNATTFGIAIAASSPASTYFQVDAVRMTVYYATGGGTLASTADAVLFASRTAELRTEGMYRYDIGGTALAPISTVVGDLPRLPPSGLESRLVEVLIKMSRSNLATEADGGIDDLSAQIKYRPTYLLTP